MGFVWRKRCWPRVRVTESQSHAVWDSANEAKRQSALVGSNDHFLFATTIPAA